MLNFKKVTLAIALTALTISLIQPIAAQSAEIDSYIVGTWNTPANGSIAVTGSDGFYEGTVVKNFFYGECEQGFGDLMIKMVGTGYGSLDTNGITLLGSFQAKTASAKCTPISATAEFKLTKKSGVLNLNTCPTWGGECLNLSKDAPAEDYSRPTIVFQKDLTLSPKNIPIQQIFTVSDNSEQVRVQAQLYSDGKLVWPKGDFWRSYSGDPVLITFRAPVGETGPFYICAVAMDDAGNKTGEFDNCYWRSIEGAMEKMANGCGRMSTGITGKVATFFQNAFLDKIWYPIGVTSNKDDMAAVEYLKVDVRPACQNHDAGYQGATFYDDVDKKMIDTRTKSRAWVDEKFKKDIITLCKRQLTKRPGIDFLATCKSGPSFSLIGLPSYLARTKFIGATTYATAVAEWAKGGYDTDSTKVGIQSVIPAKTLPTGGSRSNRSEPKALYDAKK